MVVDFLLAVVTFSDDDVMRCCGTDETILSVHVFLLNVHNTAIVYLKM